MTLFFYKVWQFLKRTVFSLKWWKENWYLPWFFIVGLVVWIFTGGRGSALNLIKRTNKIKEEERETVKEIERKSDKAVSALEESARLEKASIQKETQEKITAQEAAIKKAHDAIKDDSEAINKELNDALDV
jgi:biopolymer transport protein ExbB/TolQ